MKSWARLSLRKERKRYAAEGAFVLVHTVALDEGAAIDHHAKLYQQRTGSVGLSASHQPLLIAADYVQRLVDQLCGVASWSCCFLLLMSYCIELCPVHELCEGRRLYRFC